MAATFDDQLMYSAKGQIEASPVVAGLWLAGVGVWLRGGGWTSTLGLRELGQPLSRRLAFT